jgi:hypothetical protein
MLDYDRLKEVNEGLEEDCRRQRDALDGLEEAMDRERGRSIELERKLAELMGVVEKMISKRG